MMVVGVFKAPTTIPAVAVDGHTGQSGGALDTTLFTVRCVTRQLTVEIFCPLVALDSPVRSDFVD
jgi:hypothetical protein